MKKGEIYQWKGFFVEVVDRGEMVAVAAVSDRTYAVAAAADAWHCCFLHCMPAFVVVVQRNQWVCLVCVPMCLFSF